MVAASSTFLRSSAHFFGQTIEIHTPSSAAPACVRFRSPRFSATYTSTKRTSSPFQSAKMASTTISLYEVLGIPMGATCQEIKSAYRKLARVCHPDVVAIDRKDTSADEFKKIHAAYSTLSDPAKRADYDQKLFKRHRSFSSPFTTSASSSMSSTMSGFSGYTRRTWETDQCW